MNGELRNTLANKVINNHILLATGCGAIPAPLIDIGATTLVQMRMVKELCVIYEVKWDEHVVKSIIASALGSIGKRMGTSMLKSIPIVGTIVGGFANAILSGVSTYAMGNAFMKYMQINGTVKSVTDINTSVFGGLFNDFTKKGSGIKNRIKDIVNEYTGQKGAPQGDELMAYGEAKFGSKEKFHAWLNTPLSLIDGKKPIELLLGSDPSSQDQVKKLIDLSVAVTA